MSYSKHDDGLLWFYVVAFVVTLSLLWIWSSSNDGREAACIRNGYAPVYSGRLGAVEYCQRVIKGQSEVIDPDDLP